MPQKFTFSLEYIENEESLITAKASNAYNILSPIWGQYGSNLGSLWPLSSNPRLYHRLPNISIVWAQTL